MSIAGCKQSLSTSELWTFCLHLCATARRGLLKHRSKCVHLFNSLNNRSNGRRSARTLTATKRWLQVTTNSLVTTMNRLRFHSRLLNFPYSTAVKKSFEKPPDPDQDKDDLRNLVASWLSKRYVSGKIFMIEQQFPISSFCVKIMLTGKNEKALGGDANTAAGCSKAEPKMFAPPQTPSRGRGTAKI